METMMRTSLRWLALALLIVLPVNAQVAEKKSLTLDGARKVIEAARSAA